MVGQARSPAGHPARPPGATTGGFGAAIGSAAATVGGPGSIPRASRTAGWPGRIPTDQVLVRSSSQTTSRSSGSDRSMSNNSAIRRIRWRNVFWCRINFADAVGTSPNASK